MSGMAGCGVLPDASPSQDGRADLPATPRVGSSSCGREDGMVTPPPPLSAPRSSVRRLSRLDACQALTNLRVSVTDLHEANANAIFQQQILQHKRSTHPMSPSPRFGHTAVVHGSNMVMFGGRDNGCYNDLWLYSFPDGKWKQVQQDPSQGPISRAGHTAVVHGDSMYIFGGVAARGGVHNWWLNDLWKLDLRSFEWSHIHFVGARSPEPRKGHTAVVHGGKMYVFGGGQDDPNQPLILYNDVWELDFATGRWAACNYTGAIPPPRMYHVAALREGGKYVVFGGRADTEAGFLNDVFEIDLEAMCAAEVITYGLNPPAQRMCSTALYHNNTLSIFTGGAYTYLEDSHQLDFRTMTWTPIQKNIDFGGRTRPTTVKWQNTIMTFGGYVTGSGYVNDQVEIELKPPSLEVLALRHVAQRGESLTHELAHLPRHIALKLAITMRPLPYFKPQC